jgi:hypothetical protein
MQTTFKDALSAVFAAALLTGSAEAGVVPFDVPWIGYDTAVYPEGIFPLSSQSADLNADGVPDLATVSVGGTAWLSVLLGDGGGGYLPPTTYPLIIESMDLAVADFDGDDDLDIVTADTGRFWEGSSVSLYVNDGTGTFAYENSYSIGNFGPSGIAAADLDGDGWTDIATANDAYIECNNTVSVLMNNAGSGFQPADVYPIGSCTNEIDSGDLDGDGDVDLAIAHETNRFTTMMNDGEGGFAVSQVVEGIMAGSIPEDPTVHIADIDLDGHADIFFSNQNTGGVGAGAVGLWRNDGAGGFGPAETLSFDWYNGGAIDVETADVTGDGWPDVLCATGAEGNWFLFESNGAGGFGTPRRLRAGHAPSVIDTPDLDQDGDPDVMVLGSLSLEACVYLNPGDGSFVQPGVLEFVDPAISPAFTTNIESGDVDADGDLDLAVGFRSDFEESFGLTVRRNNGDGTFGPRETYEHFTYPVFIRLRDLDGDDDLDLVWIESDGRFRLRFNDGAGAFGDVTSSSTVGAGGYFDLYDVDNDEDSDLVAAVGSDVGVLLNDGDGAFSSPIYSDIDGFFDVLGMGDFDGDGNLDLLTNSAPQGYPQISFGHGDGTFGPAFTVSTGRDVVSFAIGQIDHDGDLDFAAVYNLDEGGVSIRRGRGDGNFFVPDHCHGSFQWDDYTRGGRTELVDVDGDGNRDLLFANVQAQDFSYWKGIGDGTYEEVRRCGAGHNVHDLTAGDFNGDGVIDVAMSAEVDDGRWWYTGVVIIDGVSDTQEIPGDVNDDGVVDTADLLALLAAWGPCPDPPADCPADLDGDGAVGTSDLLVLLANWG